MATGEEDHEHAANEHGCCVTCGRRIKCQRCGSPYDDEVDAWGVCAKCVPEAFGKQAETAIHCTCGPGDDSWDCALHDEELPGMWEHADFTGGRDEVRGPDWAPDQNGKEAQS